MFACWRIGAIAALVNVRFADELDYYFGDHTPSVVIYTHDMGEPVRAAGRAGALDQASRLHGRAAGGRAFAAGAAGGRPSRRRPIHGTRTRSRISPTPPAPPGKPKGACLRHEPTVRASRCIAERLRIRPHDVSFGPTALSSSYQLVGNLLPPLAAGAPIHVMGRWTQTTG